MDKITIVRKKISELKFAPYNPRKASRRILEQLKQSIKEFGYVDPIVYNKRTGHVVGGNQRLKVLKELGYEEVDVVEIDIPEDKEKLLNIALNKIQADWDIPLLKSLLRSLEDVNLTIAGFSETELNRLLPKHTIYTTKIPRIQYKPTGQKPDISELYDATKYYALLKEIDSIEGLTEEEKHFLKLSATRFIEYRFDKIAEYYAHSSPQLQRIMEKLALVIIDFNDAIENGLIEITRKINEFIEGLKSDEG